MSARLSNHVLFALILGASVSVACRADSGSRRSPNATATAGTAGPIDACALFKQSDIAGIVGSPVEPGRAFAGPEVCKWDAEPGNVTVLLTVRGAGSDREKVLCSALGKGKEGAQRLDGPGDVAMWKFSNTMGLFNSGELETCSKTGYVAVTLNGKPDEPKLKQAAVTLVRNVLQGR